MENYFSINASLQPRFIHVCQMFDQLLKDKHVFFTLYTSFGFPMGESKKPVWTREQYGSVKANSLVDVRWS